MPTLKNIGEKTELILVKNDGKFKKTIHSTLKTQTETNTNSIQQVMLKTIIDIAEEAYNVGELFVYGDKLYIKHKDGVAQVDKNKQGL